MILTFRCVSAACDGQTYVNVEFNADRHASMRLADHRTMPCPACGAAIAGSQMHVTRDSPFAEEDKDGKG